MNLKEFEENIDDWALRGSPSKKCYEILKFMYEHSNVFNKKTGATQKYSNGDYDAWKIIKRIGKLEDPIIKNAISEWEEDQTKPHPFFFVIGVDSFLMNNSFNMLAESFSSYGGAKLCMENKELFLQSFSKMIVSNKIAKVVRMVDKVKDRDFISEILCNLLQHCLFVSNSNDCLNEDEVNNLAKNANLSYRDKRGNTPVFYLLDRSLFLFKSAFNYIMDHLYKVEDFNEKKELFLMAGTYTGKVKVKHWRKMVKDFGLKENKSLKQECLQESLINKGRKFYYTNFVWKELLDGTDLCITYENGDTLLDDLVERLSLEVGHAGDELSIPNFVIQKITDHLLQSGKKNIINKKRNSNGLVTLMEKSNCFTTEQKNMLIKHIDLRTIMDPKMKEKLKTIATVIKNYNKTKRTTEHHINEGISVRRKSKI